MDNTIPNARRKARAGGRRGNQARRGDAALTQMPWRQVLNPDRPTEPLDEAGIAAIHDAAMHVLEEIGIEFLNTEALDLFRQAGCIVTDQNVRMGRDWVMEMIAKAPSSFTLTPRNPAHQVTIGDGHIAFCCVASPPSYYDLDLGKKVTGQRSHFQRMMKLVQSFNCLHLAGGYPVEPIDLHPSIRHLDALHDTLTLTDKVVHAYSLGPERVEDVLEMCRISGGWSPEDFAASPKMYTNINSTSPLKHDIPMIDGCLRCLRKGQAVIVTPFTLAGAMAPVTMAGAVALSLAEALSAIALFQWVAPGSACGIGTFTSNVDMKSGAPAFGTPEYMRATQMTGQMARFYGLPLRSSGVCTSNVPDGQAMWETSNSLWAAVQSGTNMVFHAAGWLEGGLIACPEKLVMDCEVLQMIQRYCEPVITETTPEALAVDAIAEVGPEGHYFGIEHTQQRYETAFYQPFVSDWRNFEAWEKAGAEWTPQRANRLWKQIEAEFEAPPMDAAIREELDSFVARRKQEGGAPTDF